MPITKWIQSLCNSALLSFRLTTVTIVSFISRDTSLPASHFLLCKWGTNSCIWLKPHAPYYQGEVVIENQWSVMLCWSKISKPTGVRYSHAVASQIEDSAWFHTPTPTPWPPHHCKVKSGEYRKGKHEMKGEEMVLERGGEKQIWRFRWWKCGGCATGKLEMWADTIVC